MEPKLNQRKDADKTRHAIIKAATKLFAAGGFSGTSTLSIAKAAKVNEALIFHHFGNKEELWKKVKAEISEHGRIGRINPQPASLRAFLEEAIEQRLALYDRAPLLHKIVQWQRLEDKRDALLAPNPSATDTWIPAIHHLQKHSQIKKSLPAELLAIWLAASINAVIQDDLKIFHNQKIRDNYINLIIAGFEQALT